jgi:hypothetical protein
VCRQEKQSEMGEKLKVPYTYVIRMFYSILLPYLDFYLKCSRDVAKLHRHAMPHCVSCANSETIFPVKSVCFPYDVA